jgi:Rrf2 family transcriptional regulator, cysteine metabolism repressor
MIRFSNKVKYGIQFLLFLDVDNEEFTDIQRAALSCNIPHKFMEAIAVDLKKRGILEVKRGAGGGYRLTKDPREVLLSDIVLTLETISSKPDQKDMELTRQVVEETLNESIDGFWQIMKDISLYDMQQKYYASAEKIMYYI